MKKKKTIKNILAHTVLTLLAIVWVSPLVWIILTSFRAQKGAYTSSFFPKSYSLDNYIKLFTDTGILNFPRMFTNTLIVAVFSCIISTFFVLSVAYINQLYNEKIIDNDFLLRTSTNICELIENGLCGSFFGPWWAPNNPLANAVSINPDSNWQPYLISTGDNVTEYHSQNPCYKYVVVRKGYEYPEIAAKMISVMFDKIRFDCADSEEFDNYYQLNVEPTARPLSINVDYNNALSICYRNISDAIEGRKDSDNLELLERSYYNACKSYLNNTGLANTSYEYNTDDSYKEYSQSGRKGATSTQWAAYMSRIKACRLLDEGNIVIKQSLYFKTTDTMKNRWWKLKSLEKEAYLKIISGEADIDYFDTFVSEWNAQGGIIITEEVRENIVR